MNSSNSINLIIHLIRYRFFLFAGIFPYLLGQAIAFNSINSINSMNSINWRYFGLGFLGILLVLISVELFNEYFDAKEGGDRIFAKSQEPRTKSRNMTLCHMPFALSPFLFALCSLLLAFVIGFYLTLKIGWPILLFSFLGFLGAYFYVGPPIRWAYRGFGELVIALCYGPFMVLGSYYLQTKRIDFEPFFVSLILGLVLFCLALLNEIPDYYQDRLVGKKNLVARLGKKRAVKLFSFGLFCLYSLLGLGIARHIVPLWGITSFFLIPWLIKSLKVIEENYDSPRLFLSAINTNIIAYLVIVLTLGIGYLR